MESKLSKLIKLGIPVEWAADLVALGLDTPAKIKAADPEADQRIREAQAFLRRGRPD